MISSQNPDPVLFMPENLHVWVHDDFKIVIDGLQVRLYAGERYYCGHFAIPTVLKALRALFLANEDSLSGDTAALMAPHTQTITVCRKNEFGKRMRGRPRQKNITY